MTTDWPTRTHAARHADALAHPDACPALDCGNTEVPIDAFSALDGTWVLTYKCSDDDTTWTRSVTL
jgi:hypothetical protein